MGYSPISYPASSVVIPSAPGMISIYTNISNVFTSIFQNLSLFHKSYQYDCYVSSCCSWLSGLSNESIGMASVYAQFIPLSSQAVWSPVSNMSEVQIFSEVSKQLFSFIHSVSFSFLSLRLSELERPSRDCPPAILKDFFFYGHFKHLHFRSVAEPLLPARDRRSSQPVPE